METTSSVSELQVRLPFLEMKNLSAAHEIAQEGLNPSAWEWVVPVLADVPVESRRGIQTEEKF